MKFFDCHTHVEFAAFRDDWKEVIARALQTGVFLVNVGTQKDTSRRAVEIANEYENGVYATVGVHPIHTDKSFHDAQELGLSVDLSAITSVKGEAPAKEGGDRGFTSRGEEFDYEYYKNLARGSRVVAIGECGLDYYRIKNNESEIKEKQRASFIKQIELAHEFKKPLMIHCRDAYEDLVKILNSKLEILNTLPGIVHFFSGTKEDAKELLEMGFYFTFGGVVTFTRDYDEVIKMIPTNRILSETDAPYVTPVPYRGKRNEPAYVVEAVKKLAEIKSVSFGVMRDQIWENAIKVFQLDA